LPSCGYPVTPSAAARNAAAARPAAARALTVFRKRGVTIAETARASADFAGEGLTGTPAEMAVLADQLAAAGVAVTLLRELARGR
jgi:hypothetical protein